MSHVRAESLDVDARTAALLQRYGFDAENFEVLRERLRQGAASEETNRVKGAVTPPEPGDVRALPPLGSDARNAFAKRGEEAIRGGEVAAVVLAGGMATRFGGVVKAGVEAVGGRSFLDLKLADIRRTAEAAGGVIPVFVMTSFATHEDVSRLARDYSSAATPTETFAQFVSLRLTPNGDVFRGADASVSPYAPGHGDLTFALRRSGLLSKLVERGGRVLYMSNVDNLGATLDPGVIGAHLAFGAAVTAEVVLKEPGDKGGGPARVDGQLQIVEDFRFPAGFDKDSIAVFNANSFALDARAIDYDFPLTWFAVRKKVDDHDVVQFERLVGELTAFLPGAFLRVERHGPDGRFHPVKDPEELELRRAEIEDLMRARGVL